jgi:hypothetical protein
VSSAPGRFCFFGPQAWAALSYARARTPGAGNLSSLLSTEESALAAHFKFLGDVTRSASLAAAGGGEGGGEGGGGAGAAPNSPAGGASHAALSASFLSAVTPEKDSASAGAAPSASPRGGGQPAPAARAAARSAAVGVEVAAVVGRSLVREALAATAAANAAAAATSPGNSAPAPTGAAVGAGGVRFMLVLMTPDGRALLTEPGTGAPLLLRSAAPMLDVELALGALARAGRRQLGPAAAAAMQAEGAGQEAANALAQEILVSPPWSAGARNAAAAARAAASPTAAGGSS